MKPRYRRDAANQPDLPAPAQPIVHVPHVRSRSHRTALRPLRHDTFGALADHLTAALDSPIRVEVHEADGSTFTDILTPPRRRSRFAPPEPAFPQKALTAEVPALIEVSADGFAPGEDVALAVIVAHSDAGPAAGPLQKSILEFGGDCRSECPIDGPLSPRSTEGGRRMAPVSRTIGGRCRRTLSAPARRVGSPTQPGGDHTPGPDGAGPDGQDRGDGASPRRRERRPGRSRSRPASRGARRASRAACGWRPGPVPAGR